jgi:hypothetical protein
LQNLNVAFIEPSFRIARLLAAQLTPSSPGEINVNKLRVLEFVSIVLTTGLLAASAFAQGNPTAPPPYQLSVFASAPAGLSAPDSIAVQKNHVFVGYGDGHDPGGADGLSSQVVEYRIDGSVVHIYTVKGHNDGIKIDPLTQKVWALQNEDANPNLVIINPETQHQKEYTFGVTPHGGGYDDIVFRGCQVYISASNPANNPNTAPAIVSARLEGNTVDVEPAFAADASVINVVTGETETLNLQDPDSMTLDLLGNIVLDSQADDELIIVSNPGKSNQSAVKIPLSFLTPGKPPTTVEVDDTVFVNSNQGFILFADKALNKVYKLTTSAFAPGSIYTAADGGPFVGTLDLTTGIITPIVTGLGNPGGMVFVSTADRGQDQAVTTWDGDDRDSCGDRD